MKHEAMTLLTPAQLELAHAHLAPWLGSRSVLTIGEATDRTLSNMVVAGVDPAERRGAQPRALAAILRILGYVHINGSDRDAIYVRRGSQSEERLRGLAYALAWRERNAQHFNALYGDGGAS